MDLWRNTNPLPLLVIIGVTFALVWGWSSVFWVFSGGVFLGIGKLFCCVSFVEGYGSLFLLPCWIVADSSSWFVCLSFIVCFISYAWVVGCFMTYVVGCYFNGSGSRELLFICFFILFVFFGQICFFILFVWEPALAVCSRLGLLVLCLGF